MRQFKRLAHSVWDCKYHIVWIPKYRRKASYGEKRKVIVASIKKWAQIKGIENQYHQYTGGIDSRELKAYPIIPGYI